MPSPQLGLCTSSFASMDAFKNELVIRGEQLVHLKSITISGRQYTIGQNGKVKEQQSWWQKALRFFFGARAAYHREQEIELALRQARNRETMGGGIFVPTPSSSSSSSPSPVSSPLVIGAISPSSTILPSGVGTPAHTWGRLEDIPWFDSDEIEAAEEGDEISREVGSPQESGEYAVTRTDSCLQLVQYYLQQIRGEVESLAAKATALQGLIPLIDPVAERVKVAKLAAEIVMVSNAQLTVGEALVTAGLAVGVAQSAVQSAQKALASLGEGAGGDDTVSYMVGRANAAVSAAEGAVSTAQMAAEGAATASAAVEAFGLQTIQL